MAETFRCQVVTPTEKLLDTEVVYASVPAHDGLFGILPGRAPIVSELGAGTLTLRFPSTAEVAERQFFVNSGFAKMSSQGLVVLAEEACAAERLSVSDVKAECDELAARNIAPDTHDKAAATDALTRSRQAAAAKLRLAETSRGKGV